MTFEIIPFYDLVKAGRSVVFVPTRSLALDLQHRLIQAGVGAITPTSLSPIVQTFRQWGTDERLMPTGVLIAVVPTYTHGVRLRADRVVWVGATPELDDHGYTTYVQAMARADHTLHEYAQRHHYSEAEVFPQQQSDALDEDTQQRLQGFRVPSAKKVVEPRYRVVGTSNFDNEMVSEVWASDPLSESDAYEKAREMNSRAGSMSKYFYVSRPETYKLYKYEP